MPSRPMGIIGLLGLVLEIVGAAIYQTRTWKAFCAMHPVESKKRSKPKRAHPSYPS